MKTLKLISILFISSTLELCAQSGTAELEKAERLLAGEQFGAALPIYLNLLENDSLNPSLNFKAGICYLNSRSQKAKAVYYLNKAIEPTSAYYSNGSNQQKDGMTPQSVLGPSRLSYDFEKVNECSEKFRKIVNDVKDKELSVVEVLNLKMELKKIGEELQEFNDSPINFKIETSPQNNTSSYVGYSSVQSKDKGLVFNFEKPESKWVENNEERMFFEESKIVMNIISTDSAIKEDIDSFLNSADTSSTEKEANVAVSDDNQVILTYRDVNGDGNLFISCLKGNTWSKPLKLNKIINTKGWEPNECITEDGNWLYFTSERQGGYGGSDIYRCRKLPNGEWSKASNLGPMINTAYDDRAPFLLPGGHTLYFSTNGRNTHRSFDIYTSSVSGEDDWSDPVKIGYPFIAPMETGTMAQAKNETTNAENYIYTFKNKNETPLRIVKGNVVDSTGNDMRFAKIKVVDNETGAVITFSNPGTDGAYSFILPSGKNKNITYQADGCLFQSENVCPSATAKFIEKTNEITMYPIAPGSRIVLKNVFFETNQATLSDVSKTELENVYHLLIDNPGLKIEISDYMLSKEHAKANKLISQQRAQAVEAYLLKKGIAPDRIVSKGYVKYKPKSPVKKPVNGEMPQQMATDWIELKVIAKKNS